MNEIQLPDLLSKDRYMGLTPHDQEEYVATKMLEILKLNSTTGVMLPEVVAATPFARPTILKHLERIVSTRGGYKIKRGAQVIYYHNGQLAHHAGLINVKGKTGVEFRAMFLKNNYGDFIHLEDIAPKISGGSMLLRLADLKDFKDFVNEIWEKSHQVRGE
jgi:hypothetical protein